MKKAAVPSILIVVVLLALGVASPGAAAEESPADRLPIATAKATPRDEAFVKQLRDLGWVDGQNIAIEYRWAANKAENLATLADELVGLKVDMIAAGTTPAVHAAKNATKTIPIVMISVADAVGSGFVANLAQPGGNVTGTTNIMPELAGKRLELLKEVLPKLSRIAFLAYGPDPAHRLFVKDTQDAAQSFKVGFQPFLLRSGMKSTAPSSPWLNNAWAL